MRSSSFPRDILHDAKSQKKAVIRLQYDARHLGEDAVEIVAVAPDEILDALRILMDDLKQIKPDNVH